MDHKRALTSVDLRALVPELSAYTGAVLDKAYLYGEDLVRLKLRDFERGRIELLIEVGDRKRVHTVDPEHVPDAPERPPNFAKMLRNRIAGANLVGVEQYGFDRILQFHFEREDTETTIVAELFGDGNVAVLDADGTVIDSLRTVRLSSRTVAPGAAYGFPEARVDPLALEYDPFRERMAASETDLVRTLATQFDLGGDWAEELCTRAGVEKTLPIAEATDEQYESLYWELNALADRLEEGPLDPRVYYTDEQPIDVTPLPFEERAGQTAERFEKFNAALDTYFHALETTTEEEAQPTEPNRPDFESEIEKQQRIIEQQRQAIADFEADAEAYRTQAETLYAHYDLVDELLSTVQRAREAGEDWPSIESTLAAGADQGIPAAEAVESIDPEEERLQIRLDEQTIWLDVTADLEHNADRLYTEAKRIEEKKAGAEAAIEDTKERLEEIKARREAWEADPESDDESDEDAAETRTDEEWLSMASIPVRGADDDAWYEQFRWYRTRDGFLVIGGRDADQNEALVKKYLEPGDRFLHTQARGGPVTILKAAGPSESGADVTIPEQAEREAAQFAVSYSSIWKDGRYAGDVYAVDHDQVSKTPESGEFLEKGAFAIRGDRTYYDDVAVGVAVGISCEPDTRVIGGPPVGIDERTVTAIHVEPGRYAQGDVAKRIYRTFRERFRDTDFVRAVASPDRIQHFLPPGGSRIVEE